ncbi:3-hydroxybutyryl-CoA dehydrogenase [Thermoplasmatales archaeon SW_10_69_26]|nr:MAG: 3-hydroxybutyryl-CoA dehydrogenase [Thermoplasmatales archaeon SW_10_69_26]
MSLDDIDTIGVVGAGQMGSGIAQIAASTGYDVVMRDIKQAFLDEGLSTIEGSLARFVERDAIDERERDEILARIETTTAIEEMREIDVAIEAVVEDEDVKTSVFADLDQVTDEHAILTTNTSSIPITTLASATDRPNQVAGMHFFNPVPVMDLVEVIRGHDTSNATAETVIALARDMGKDPVEVEDLPGFVSNRVLMPMLNEAMFALHEGVADAEAIDQVMRMGMNHPMGPLELADFVGLDTCLHILDVLRDGYGDPKYRPAPILKQKVEAGHLGKKTGRGFYVWDEGDKVAPAD